MFVDTVSLTLVAGSGGNGVVAWRREKYIPKGGPYGGNGGPGGDLIFEGTSSLFSLEPYRNRRFITAENGKAGGSNQRQGGSGDDRILKIPFGTLVKDAETGHVLFDCSEATPRWVVCQGGRGGRGNASFKSPTRQAPHFATSGSPGEKKEVQLELKLIADVGLVGMPNAGKSTLLSQITHTRVKIAPYPFTTLSPNLSYIQNNEDYTRILIADIPGIIEKASDDKGLGLLFLKHIERCSVLLFVIDLSGIEGRDPYQDFLVLRQELSAYRSDLLEKPFLVALNKIDEEGALEYLETFKAQYPFDPATLFPISALHQEGLAPLIEKMQQRVRASRN
jgi:GTP-binding protein